jgi:hypothetical protein
VYDDRKFSYSARNNYVLETKARSLWIRRSTDRFKVIHKGVHPIVSKLSTSSGLDAFRLLAHRKLQKLKRQDTENGAAWTSLPFVAAMLANILAEPLTSVVPKSCSLPQHLLTCQDVYAGGSLH